MQVLTSSIKESYYGCQNAFRRLMYKRIKSLKSFAKPVKWKINVFPSKDKRVYSGKIDRPPASR